MTEQTTLLARASGLSRRRRQTLTDKQVTTLKRRTKRYIIADPEQRGMYLRVPVSGPVVYAAVARHQGKQTWATLGTADVLTIAEARDRAREAIRRIKEGLEPFAAPPVKPDSVTAVTTQWLKRHVEARGLRTAAEIKRRLDVYILPLIGDSPFAQLRRGDIARLLDVVEDKHGPWVADAVLVILRSISNWYSARDDNYVAPFVRNMRRVPLHARRRSRVLSDDELRKVWSAAEQKGSFGAFVQLSLLLAQRREKLATMEFSNIKEGIWTIPTAEREKGTPGQLKLPQLALNIIAKQPRLLSNPYVFPGRGAGHVRGFDGLKAAFDKKSGVSGYSLHDLRRTARSLMSRAGVQSEIAERVLGHARPGVEGIYDRHSYLEEMGHALVKLAALIERIVAGPSDNVVVMSERVQP